MEDTDVGSFSFRKEKPAEEEAEGPITDPRYLWGLSKRDERGLLSTEKGMGFAKPETWRERAAFSRLAFQKHR